MNILDENTDKQNKLQFVLDERKRCKIQVKKYTQSQLPDVPIKHTHTLRHTNTNAVE